MAYTPRLTAPTAADPRWIQINSGGYNQCIYGSAGPPSGLPNCTGYVHGRVMEIRGVNTDDSGLSFNDAISYWNGSSSNWIQEQNPSLGAVVCYSTKGNTSGWPGHVAIVEQVIDSDTIIVSESDYGDPAHGVAGVRFRTLRCYRNAGWRPSTVWNVEGIGFLKNPYVDGGGGGGDLPKSVLLLLLQWRLQVPHPLRFLLLPPLEVFRLNLGYYLRQQSFFHQEH